MLSGLVVVVVCGHAAEAMLTLQRGGLLVIPGKLCQMLLSPYMASVVAPSLPVSRREGDSFATIPDGCDEPCSGRVTTVSPRFPRGSQLFRLGCSAARHSGHSLAL